MSDDRTASEPTESTGGWLLTAEASAIIGFTLAVTSLLGQTSWTTAVQAFFGSSFAESSFDNVLVWYGVASLAMAGVSMWFGRRATEAEAGSAPTWAGHLARAAIVLAAFGALFAVLTVLGGLIHG
jgi:hypothetical protein